MSSKLGHASVRTTDSRRSSPSEHHRSGCMGAIGFAPEIGKRYQTNELGIDSTEFGTDRFADKTVLPVFVVARWAIRFLTLPAVPSTLRRLLWHGLSAVDLCLPSFRLSFGSQVAVIRNLSNLLLVASTDSSRRQIDCAGASIANKPRLTG